MCNLGSVNLAHARQARRRAWTEEAEEDRPHRGPHARQRHRHQLLLGAPGAHLQPEAIVRSAWASWASRTRCTNCACPTAPDAAVDIRGPLHGSDQLLRHRGVIEAGRQERGAYASFSASLWSRGILPIDSLNKLLRNERGQGLSGCGSEHHHRLGCPARPRCRSTACATPTCMAIAPTATIANITGVSQSIEPTYQNLHVKSNLSGEFTVVNPYMVRDLKAAGPMGQRDGRRPEVLRRLAQGDGAHSR